VIDPTSRRVGNAEVLFILFAVNVCSVLDRTVFSITAPAIATELKLSDGEVGALAGLLFSAFYAAFGIPIARLADRGNRGVIISASIAAWSLVTMATGLASNFFQMALARIGVAVGEAGATPASHSVLSERFKLTELPAAMAVHSAGAPVGAAIALAAGGFLVAEVGWRWTFVVLGAPALFLAAWVLWRLRHETRIVPAKTDQPSRRLLPDLAILFGIPSFRWLIVGFAFGAFVVTALVQWLPAYFVRTFEASTREVGFAFAIAYGGGSLIGMLLGGWLGSRMARRDPRWTMWLASASYVAAAPLAVAVLLASDPMLAYCLAFAMSAASTVAYGPAFAMIQGLAEVRLRALASAVALFFSAFLGAGLGPFAVGLVSDQIQASPAENLRTALLLALCLMPVPVLAYLMSARRMKPAGMAELPKLFG
jgi:MFS family permease